MGHEVISFDPMNPASIARANSAIKAHYRDINSKISLYIKSLAEIGQAAARGAYGSAINVEVNEIPNGFSISANGDAIAFLEFGAGAATDSANRYAQQMPFEVRKGSYSEENHGEYAQTNYQYWHFGGVEYTEIVPRGGMQKAYEAIRGVTRSEAQRIFG